MSCTYTTQPIDTIGKKIVQNSVLNYVAKSIVHGRKRQMLWQLINENN